jgi:hypothetical protein
VNSSTATGGARLLEPVVEAVHVIAHAIPAPFFRTRVVGHVRVRGETETAAMIRTVTVTAAVRAAEKREQRYGGRAREYRRAQVCQHEECGGVSKLGVRADRDILHSHRMTASWRNSSR